MKTYLKYISTALVALTLILTSGCAVFMAAKQPSKKDVSVFKVGNPRALILAEFGLPLVTEEKNGKKNPGLSPQEAYLFRTVLGL